jgi:dolichol-phosphate mannosyltransferase
MSRPLVVETARVAIVMPAYNEADGIEEFLRELDKELAEHVGLLTIVVVDDCSTDGTLDVVRRTAASLRSTVICEQNDRNRGHGPTAMAAYERGLAEQPDLVVHVDGDGQFEAFDIARVIRHLAAGADAVVGVRQGRTDPWYRSLLSTSLRVYLRAVARIKALDPNCPLRAYRAETLQRLLHSLPADTMIPSVYLSILEHRLRTDLVELPVRSRVRRGVAAIGTAWGPGRAAIPPRRLIEFVVAAGRESLVTIPRLGRRMRDDPNAEAPR